jgi:hypothetical protein
LAILALHLFRGPQALPELPILQTRALIKAAMRLPNLPWATAIQKDSLGGEPQVSAELCTDRRSTDWSKDGFQKPTRWPDSAAATSKLGLSF